MIVKRALRKRFHHISSGNRADQPHANGTMPVAEKFTAGLVVMMPAIIGLFVFFISAYACYFSFIWTNLPFLNLLFLAMLLAVTITQAIAILAELILAPSLQRIRIVSLSSAEALICYRLIVWTWGYIVTVLLFSIVIHRMGARTDTVILVQLFAATLLLAATMVMVVLYRKQVRSYILTSSLLPGEGKISLRSGIFWHFSISQFCGALFFPMFLIEISILKGHLSSVSLSCRFGWQPIRYCNGWLNTPW